MRWTPVSLVALLLLSGCSSSERGAPEMSCGERQAFTDAKHGYGYCHKSDWTRREVGDIVVFLSPKDSPDDNFQENVNVVTETLPEGMTLATYVQRSIDSLPTFAADVKVLGEVDAQLGGKTARRLEYTGTYKGLLLHNEATITVNDGLGHVLTYSAADGHQLDHLEEARAVAASMKFV